MRIILFADNDHDFVKVRSEFLEAEGYTVLKAFSPEDARDILDHKQVHLAILDIRLTDDSDGDISGLELAQEVTCHSLPKIMLTGFPSVEAVKIALKPALDELSPAVDFLSKKDGPEALIQAVEQAFAQHVHINWDLCIHWSDNQPLSFPGLVGLIEKDLPPEGLLNRVGEIEDLFRKLFYDYDQITFSRPLWRKGGRVALEVVAHSQEKEEQFVVTCGKAQDSRDEQELYGKLAPKVAGNGSTIIKVAATTVHFGAVAWALGKADIEEVRPFSEFCRARSEKQIRVALENLFQATLAPWRQQGRFVEEGKNLSQFYWEKLGLTEEAFPFAEFQRKAQALSTEAIVHGIADITFPSDQLMFRFSGGRTLAYPDPILYLYGDDEILTTRVACWTTPGDLDVDTILVDQSGRTWLSDFSQVGPAPLLYDFVSLEASIRSRLMGTSNLQTLYDFEKELLAVTHLRQSIPASEVEPEHRKAFSAIQSIRHLASITAEDDLHSYYLGLFFCMLKSFARYDPAQRQTKSETVKLLHCLLLVAMLGEKISQVKTWHESKAFTVRGILRIDEANRQTWVGERQIDLTNTEFDLLVYLHHRAGELCLHSDIIQSVYSGTTGPNDGDSWLTTNIGRLRKKLGEGYIVTKRGQGYILVVKPE